MKILVTGGAGFIGSHLVDALAKKNEVVVLDNLSSGSEKNLEGMKVKLIRGDVRNVEDVKKACEGAEVIFHLAALAYVAESIKNPALADAVNSGGTLNILECARKGGVRKVVYASSSAVYGNAPGLPKTESSELSPESPYAITKLAGERYCAMYEKLYGIESVCLRYFNVYGPRQNPGGDYAAVVPKFIEAVKSGRQPVVYGDGEQTRDFVFVDDAVGANVLAMKKGVNGIFNIASGEEVSINGLIEVICKVMGKSIKPKYAKARAGDVGRSAADITLARKKLGYAPKYDLEQGIRETVRRI
ncbi:MAG: SDR family oxidoreductase [Candidatus Micrarchaeota archaeon]|nr:SDR family oxidoreductase [Candidatus Micrarchaeota archaeon]